MPDFAQNIRHMFVEIKWTKPCSEKNPRILKADKLPNYIFIENTAMQLCGNGDWNGKEKQKAIINVDSNKENSKTVFEDNLV